LCGFGPCVYPRRHRVGWSSDGLELSVLEGAAFALAVQVADEDVGIVLVHLEQGDAALGAEADAGAGQPCQSAGQGFRALADVFLSLGLCWAGDDDGQVADFDALLTRAGVSHSVSTG